MHIKIIIMKNLKLSLVLVFLGVYTLSFGQILEPVKWTMSKKSLSNNTYELIFEAAIENNWHLYSQDIAMQPPATLFTFEENDDIELIGDVVEISEVLEIFDTNFGMKVKYFENEAVFVQKVKILTKNEVLLEGYFEFMSCDDQQCTPPTIEDFEFVFNKVKK